MTDETTVYEVIAHGPEGQFCLVGYFRALAPDEAVRMAKKYLRWKVVSRQSMTIRKWRFTTCPTVDAPVTRVTGRVEGRTA